MSDTPRTLKVHIKCKAAYKSAVRNPAFREMYAHAEELERELAEAREWSAELADIWDRLRGQLMEANDELAKVRDELKEYKNKCDFLHDELDAIWERDAGEAL